MTKEMDHHNYVRPFEFNGMTRAEFVEQLNREFPITLKYNERLINRIHSRYPLIKKAQIAIVVQAIFASLRDLLLLGKVLSFQHLFYCAKLMFITRHNKKNTKRMGGQAIQDEVFPMVKIKVRTPINWRNEDIK